MKNQKYFNFPSNIHQKTAGVFPFSSLIFSYFLQVSTNGLRYWPL